METYSQSKIKLWRRCHKAYDYKWRQFLVRRTNPVALLRGTTLHEMLDAHVMGSDYQFALDTYRKAYNGLLGEEADGYPAPEELESLFLRYQEKYKDDGLDYRGKSEVIVFVEKDGITFRGVADKLPQDQQGRVWLMDHKTHKVIPSEDARYSDIQTVLYYWAFRGNGEQVDGILWDYLRTKPPTVPELLKKGGLTRRKDLDSDYETYSKAILENGLDPLDYQEELARLKSNVFFKRVYLPKPNTDLINSVVSDFFETAKEIQGSNSCSRNMTKDCASMCGYYQLCSAEVRGLDSEFIKKSLYRVEDPTRG